MGRPAFQRIGDRYNSADEVGNEGEFGDSPFGDEEFGGDAHPPYIIPDNALPSDDLEYEYNVKASEIVHRREGHIIASRLLKEVRSWEIKHTGVTVTECNALKVFWQDRVFKFLPDSAAEGSYVKVLWVGPFHPTPIRGVHLFELKYIIEEVFN